MLAPEGRWLGSVTMPERFHLRHITRHRVLGVARDTLGVEGSGARTPRQALNTTS